jgi:predicted adenylyl cyclase CyaB
MGRNVEIKARADDRPDLEERVSALADDGPTVIDQEDVFFFSSAGRLKLRIFSDTSGELIYYERPDNVEPTQCRYIRSPTSNPGEIRKILALALGVRGVVQKRRTLYLIGQTRVHLDRVEGLGRFVELEVVLSAGQDADFGADIARGLIEQLGIDRTDLLDRAYIDLIEAGAARSAREADERGDD